MSNRKIRKKIPSEYTETGSRAMMECLRCERGHDEDCLGDMICNGSYAADGKECSVYIMICNQA